MTSASPPARDQQRVGRVDQLRLVDDVRIAQRRGVHLFLEHPLVDRADRVLGAAEDFRVRLARVEEGVLGDDAADAALDAFGAEGDLVVAVRPRATPWRRMRRRRPCGRPRSARGCRRPAERPGMRRPVRTMTLPSISRRRIALGEPTSPLPSGVIVAALRPSPCALHRAPRPRARRRFWLRGAARARGRSARKPRSHADDVRAR